MRFLSLCLLLSLPSWGGADVFKWTDDHGRAQYSDRPVAGAEHVPVKMRSELPRPKSSNEAVLATTDLGPYESFEIVRPAANETLRSATGEVPISLIVDPAIAQDHHLRLLLDGQPVPGDAQGTQIALKGLSLGTHRIQAAIFDGEGNRIATTAPVDFHLRTPLPESALR
jgi:hypothetical protein